MSIAVFALIISCFLVKVLIFNVTILLYMCGGLRIFMSCVSPYDTSRLLITS